MVVGDGSGGRGGSREVVVVVVVVAQRWIETHSSPKLTLPPLLVQVADC